MVTNNTYIHTQTETNTHNKHIAENQILKMSISTDRYFADYEDLEVHELMLKDRPRQTAYYNAIVNNGSLFKDKVVLDVGAGTGILSAFCAKAGAKLVYAVEASELAKIALQIIEDNGLTPIVKVVQSKIEDFLLPSNIQKVDIIVSEWMGFYLLHEGMLDSVLFARDNFLKPDGLMFPSEATLYIAPCEVPSRYDYWDNVDGIKMNKFAEKLREQKSSKPEITALNECNLLHEGSVLHWMNLRDITIEDLDEINYKEILAVQRAGRHEGFCIWFDCRFPSEHYEDAVVLSTSPKAPQTHWKQCIIVLPACACETVEINEPVGCELKLVRKPNDRRKYDLEVELLDPINEQHPVPCDCHYTKCILTKAHLATMDTD